MTTRQVLLWIHMHLVPHIEKALAEARKKNPALLYSTDWLVAITYRETWTLIKKYASSNTKPDIMHSLMRGDYSQRPGEKEASYHGYGYTQIDIASYPEFVKSGAWKDPFKLYQKTIAVLEEKRLYIESKLPKLGGDQLQRAITAAYNCGQGNVVKALVAGNDVDSRTTNRDYSREVGEKRIFYREIELEQKN
jgi:hypothetical protein